MPAFVKDLRSKWNIGEFPFYFVEIAPFNYEGADGTSAARMREVQQQNMKDIPNSGMVTTLDIGHPVFIQWIKKLWEIVWLFGPFPKHMDEKDLVTPLPFINQWKYLAIRYISM